MTDRDRALKSAKKYNLVIPERLDNKYKELVEYILCCHYEDHIMSAGACAFILNMEKYDFQTKILRKYGIDFSK